MTETQKERPTTLVRRQPKPAADERTDPIDSMPAVSAAPTSRPARAGRREPTIAISPRISIRVMEVLDAAIEREGISQRQAIEDAIMARWAIK